MNITLDDKFSFINHCLNSLTLLLGNSPSMTSNLIFLDLCKLYLEILPIFFFAFLLINELNETGPFFPSNKNFI